MFKKLVIANMPIGNENCRVTLLTENGRPAELSVASLDHPSLLGGIYLGRIDSIQNNLSAAFVRIQPDQLAFLPLPEGHQYKAGDELLVQVEREDVKEKLPRLTTKLSFPGRYLVLHAGGRGCSFSKKLGLEDRKRLQRILHAIAAPETGVTARTAAAEASEEEIREEYLTLETQLLDVQLYGTKRTCYSCLREPEEDWMQMLLRCSREELNGITTDDPDIYDRIAAIWLHDRGTLPGEEELRLYEDRLLPLYKLYSMTTLLTELTARLVHLRSGGSVVIEQTEAFVAIDVNTGRFAGKKSAQETRMMINREAAQEIASQIRLRQLSGTILIDFISMKDDSERQELISLMRDYLAPDPNPATVIDITKLDIMELTRKRLRRSLREQLQIWKRKQAEQNEQPEQPEQSEQPGRAEQPEQPGL